MIPLGMIWNKSKRKVIYQFGIIGAEMVNAVKSDVSACSKTDELYFNEIINMR